MPSGIHLLLLQAMRQKRPLHCTYQGFHREICPILLGRTGLEEKALVFQYAGDTSQGPITTPDWKCFRIGEIEDAVLRDGPWRAGTEHSAPSTA